MGCRPAIAIEQQNLGSFTAFYGGDDDGDLRLFTDPDGARGDTTLSEM